MLEGKAEKSLEVKDLGQLQYFLGIEIAISSKGIILSQQKYILDLLAETRMLGCRHVAHRLTGITILALN